METWKKTTKLIEAAREGDQEAFNELVSKYTDTLESFLHHQAGRRIRSRLELEDLVQETFLRAFQSIGQFRGDSSGAFWAWLRTIGEHVILDVARRLRARKGPGDREISLNGKLRARGGDSWNLEKALEAAGTNPGQALRRNERFERLKRVLKTLPPDHARVIFLARLQGLPMKEVARRMERTPEATSMLLLRALLKLKTAFGDTESLHLPDRSLEEEGDRYGE